MFTPEVEMRETDDFPVVVKQGKFYVSVGVLLALAGALSSILFTRSQVEAQETRIATLELALKDVATKGDIKVVTDRLDNIYNAMIDRQEAHPILRRSK